MITVTGFEYTKFNYPCGEMHVRISKFPDAVPYLKMEFERNEDIIELMLVCDAMRRMGYIVPYLELPYVPFGRQDRVAVGGDCLSLAVFAGIINSLNFLEVEVTDPHSDVTTALINNCRVITQADVFEKYLKDKSDYYLVSPDAGATKKIYHLAQRVSSRGVIECSKTRYPKTGEITGVTVHADNLFGNDCYIVDDICDGGRTFTEIAKLLKSPEMNCGKIVLMVTHGFFTKGLGVFDGLIDEIYTRKGRVK